MITYKYLTNPKVGDLIGAVMNKGFVITPCVIVGFGKSGNIQVAHLTTRCVEEIIKGEKYSKIPLMAKHVYSVVPIEPTTLSSEESKAYNLLMKTMTV